MLARKRQNVSHLDSNPEGTDDILVWPLLEENYAPWE